MRSEQIDREYESAHQYLNFVAEEDLPEVKMILQQYAARAMNRQYKKDKEKATQ